MIKEKNKTAGEVATILQQIEMTVPVSGIDLATYKTGALGVVTIAGYMPGGYQHFVGSPMTTALATALLLQGTPTRSKEEIAVFMEREGIDISFSASPSRLWFSCRTPARALVGALSLIADVLPNATFLVKHFSRERERMVAAAFEDMTDTRYLASQGLARLLYPKNHPHGAYTPKERILALNERTRGDCERYKSGLGRGAMQLVAVGDIDCRQMSRLIEKHFGGWQEGVYKMTDTIIPAPLSNANKTKVTTVRDKANVDVALGQTLLIVRTDSDYIPLSVGLNILGAGGFQTRLMQRVRVDEGLTYGIGASLKDQEDGLTCSFRVGGAFAPHLLKRGLAVTMEEIERFVEKGITATELAFQRERTPGTLMVRLGTTRGLAGTLIDILAAGLPLSSVDDYPLQVAALMVEDVNRVIHKYIDPRTLSVSIAGSITEDLLPIK